MLKDGRNPSHIKEAAALLRKGELVAFATETVYGLGADAFNASAIEKIFLLKGRPTSDPLIVHISSREQLAELVTGVSAIAEKLIAQFWPGPLTLIFNKTSRVSDLVTAGLSTVAVRMPRHPVALALIREADTPIAAPSANKFQSISPTTANAVIAELGEAVFILDGGHSDVGLESTVVSVADAEPIVLRLGAITLEELAECLGDPPLVKARQVAGPGAPQEVAQLAPGMLDFHYAPKSALRFIDSVDDLSKIGDIDRISSYVLVFSNRDRDAVIKKGFARVKVLSAQGHLEEAAKHLYEALREVDHHRPKQIVALKVPDRGLGKAINDRLKKASH